MKHQLKRGLRGAWARLLYHTGLFRLFDRCMPPRMLILAGHCVEDPECNGELPADMKLSPGGLERILRTLGHHFDLCTVGEGVRRLAGEGSAERRRRSMVALSMDDGYRDNHRTLQPLLAGLPAPATVFLESRALDERRVNWSHKYFWLLRDRDPRALVEELCEACPDAALGERLRGALERGGDLAYQVKRVLKYDADAMVRDRFLDRVFLAAGGDERALCEQLYMTWDEARELRDRGFELGGHTVRHEVLSTLEPSVAREEVEGGRDALERELGPGASATFAYPFGRRWDFDEASVSAVRNAGFRAAVTTHAGIVTRESDPMRLPRWMLEEETPLHLLFAEACGGFEFLRRFGLDLSE